METPRWLMSVVVYLAIAGIFGTGFVIGGNATAEECRGQIFLRDSGIEDEAECVGPSKGQTVLVSAVGPILVFIPGFFLLSWGADILEWWQRRQRRRQQP